LLILPHLLTPKMDDRHRLKVLDGLRAIAIILVLGYHYFVRWTPPHSPDNLYPYGDYLAHFWLFQYGDLGVQLFFMISGFVISMTLYGCLTMRHFIWKRFARLFPTMLLCSVLSFVVLTALPQNIFHPQLRDFFPSLTFSDPLIWTKLFGVPFQAIDGAYWSLFVEVKFYFWISVLYFSVGPQRFLRAVALSFGGLVLAYAAARAFDFSHLWALDFIFLLSTLPWFIAGVAFYALYANAKSRIAWVLLAEAAVALGVLRLGQYAGTVVPFIALGLSSALFLSFLKRPRWVAWLAYPPLTAIGMASYSLYLLHQYIGVAVLDLIRERIGSEGNLYYALFVPVMSGLLIIISLTIYRYWEVPAKTLLLSWGAGGRATLGKTGAAVGSDRT
jgi:peptidoglycan/LPS O-acetylase OafA/YrhL